MKKSIKCFALLLVLVLSIGLLNGCTKKTSADDEFNDGTEVLFDLGDSQISYGKMLYFISYYEMYGTYMMSYYKNYLGYEGNYWDEIVDAESGTTERDYFKQLAYDTAVYYERYKNAAVAAGLSLTPEELEECRSSAKDSYGVFSEAQIKKAGITEEGIFAAQKTLTLASKFIEQIKAECEATPEYALTKDSLPKADYLGYKTECICIAPTEGSDMTFARKDAEKAAEQITADADFIAVHDSLAADGMNATYLSRTFTPLDATIEPEYVTACSDLANGAVSPIIETENGYYFIRMIDREDESIYESALSETLEAFVDSYISTIYDTLASGSEVKTVGRKWDKLVMGTVTLVD